MDISLEPPLSSLKVNDGILCSHQKEQSYFIVQVTDGNNLHWRREVRIEQREQILGVSDSRAAKTYLCFECNRLIKGKKSSFKPLQQENDTWKVI